MEEASLLHHILHSQAELTPARYRSILENTTRNISTRYAHLSPRFYPNHCMQAKIQLRNPAISMLNHPEPFIQVLLDQHFLPHMPSLSPDIHSIHHRGHQYRLTNNALEKIGYQFVLTAYLGPRFISLSFKNTSRHWRLDIPLFYALEVINRLDDRLNQIKPTAAQSRPTAADCETPRDLGNHSQR